MDMGHLSEQLVNSALESYEKGTMLRSQIFEGSEKLRFLQIEVNRFCYRIDSKIPASSEGPQVYSIIYGCGIWIFEIW